MTVLKPALIWCKLGGFVELKDIEPQEGRTVVYNTEKSLFKGKLEKKADRPSLTVCVCVCMHVHEYVCRCTCTCVLFHCG